MEYSINDYIISQIKDICKYSDLLRLQKKPTLRKIDYAR